MHFPTGTLLTTLLISLSTLSFSAPVPTSQLSKRALTLRTYNSMSISDGPAGNAGAEAEAVWTAGLDLSDLSRVSDEDLEILKVQRENAEKAETQAFNPAIDAAGGTKTEAGKALQCGKIKNKVLKLTGLALVRRIDIAKKAAEGRDTSSVEEALADTEKKLANNIKTDADSAGQDCVGVSFVGKTSVLKLRS